jgi:exodeoxyribonuclease V beta subunit
VLNSDKRLAVGSGEQVRAIDPGDMAVLVRTNSQAEAIRGALAELKIPSYLSKTGSVFDSQEAIELYDILAAVYEPDHTGLLKAALCSCVFGFSGQMLADLDRDEQQLWKRQDQFRGFKDTWEQRGFVSMIMGLFHSDDAVLRPFSKVMAPALSERGLTNFYHLMELISQASQEHHLSMFYLLKWYREQLFVSTRNQGADELRLESDKKAVAIVTIHKSKGLEYPIVFVPYLWAGGGKPRDPIVFHDPDKAYQLCLDLKGSESDLERSRELMQFEQTAEEKRLLYVALTRASAMCRILWAGISSVDGSALGSLVHPGGCKTDDQMLEDLDNLCQQGKNRVSISHIRQTGDNGVYIPKDLPGMDLSARSRKRQVMSAWRISSFSALSTVRDGYGDPYEPKGYESGESESRKSQSGESQSKEYEPEAQVPLDCGNGSSREICLKSFPKGAGAGDFFHAVFEDLDFTDIGLVEGVVDRNLTKFGLEDKTLRESAVKAVKNILDTPLSPGLDLDLDLDPGIVTESTNHFSLQEISMAQRFTELEFFFDVNHLDFNGMGSLFAGVPNGKTYANALFKLGVKPFKGYIKGFIDLVVLHQGKWYILDYKSNFLGTTHGDYGKKAMITAMESHHYILQYHLYLVALHRYLGMRLKDYSYDRDFGGVFYLFIRGMHPESPEHGVFFHRPSKAFLDRFLAIL